MRRAMFTFGTDEQETLNQEAPARATFLRSDGGWMDYEGTSGAEWCTRAEKIKRGEMRGEMRKANNLQYRRARENTAWH